MKLFSAAVLLLAVSALPAQADEYAFSPYVSVFAGGSFASDTDAALEGVDFYKFDTEIGVTFGGALGLQINNWSRVELELSHSSYSVDQVSASGQNWGPTPTAISNTGNVNATYVFANAWFDIKNQSQFTPYIGGGLGVGFFEAGEFGSLAFLPGTEINAKNTEFAFQLGAGLKVDLTDSIAVDVGYRFKNISDVSFDFSSNDSDANGRFSSHNIQVGVAYAF